MNQTLLMMRDAKLMATHYLTVRDPKQPADLKRHAERVTLRLLHRNGMCMIPVMTDIDRMVTDSGADIRDARMVDLVSARLYNLIRQSANLTDENNKLKKKEEGKQK